MLSSYVSGLYGTRKEPRPMHIRPLRILFYICMHHLSIPFKKIGEIRTYFLTLMTDNTGIPLKKLKAGNLLVLVGKLSHMSSI